MTQNKLSTNNTNPTSLAKKSKKQQKRWGANRAIKREKGGELKIDKLFKIKVGKKSMNRKELVEL